MLQLIGGLVVMCGLYFLVLWGYKESINFQVFALQRANEEEGIQTQVLDSDTWAPKQVMLLACWLFNDEPFAYSVLQCPHLKNRHNNTYLIGLLEELNGVIFGK